MQRIALSIVCFAAGAASVALIAEGSSLFINGSLASTGVIERGGVAYVPIRDVASALKLNALKTSRGYELTAAGGANQIAGLEGKVGDMLFNGYARFQVVKVIRAKEYTNQFSGDSQKITPYPEGNDLVVVICRIKNGTSKTVSAGLPGGDDVALTDTNEHSYGPRNGVTIDVPSRGQQLLPGAAVDFALTFDVPPSAVLKDLVYQVNFFDNFAGKKKFRVSLANP
jgi:hypothetical protein